MGLKRYQKKLNIDPPIRRYQNMLKKPFLGHFLAIKQKWSSALKIEYPKKASFFGSYFKLKLPILNILGF